MPANGLTGRCADDAHAHKKRLTPYRYYLQRCGVSPLLYWHIALLLTFAHLHICERGALRVRYSAISENSAPEAKS